MPYLFARESRRPPFCGQRLRSLGASAPAGVRLSIATLAAAVVIGVSPSVGTAQLASSATAGTAEVPSVFLDCQGRMPCDRTHFRTEIDFVNWAQDRADSDVHVIATSEDVGGGGTRYTLDFIGLGEMEELTDQLTYTSSGSDVFAETLEGLTQALRIGLMRYAVQGGLGPDFDVRFTGNLGGAGDAANGDAATVTQVGDPWNYWTFRVGLSGNLELRETSTETRVNPSFSADRVTEGWKL
ncbi:MAG: hypothetical protein WD737_12935, partial [Gemmatimonadota bacterium]